MKVSEIDLENIEDGEYELDNPIYVIDEVDHGGGDVRETEFEFDSINIEWWDDDDWNVYPSGSGKYFSFDFQSYHLDTEQLKEAIRDGFQNEEFVIERVYVDEDW